jgi:hypothetical protein
LHEWIGAKALIGTLTAAVSTAHMLREFAALGKRTATGRSMRDGLPGERVHSLNID